MQHILKNLRVSARLPIVAGVSLLALVIYAFMAMNTMNQVKIGSETDERITSHSMLVGDIVPPAVNLMPVELASFELRTETDPAVQQQLEARLQELETKTLERFAYWQEHEDTNDPELKQAMAAAGEAAQRYVDIMNDELIPAINAGSDPVTLEAIETRLDDEYAAHEAALDTALSRANTVMAEDEAQAHDLLASRSWLMWGLLVLTVLVVGGAAWLVTRSVLKPLDDLRRNMDEIASGDEGSKNERLDADRRDEFGQVATSFNAFADKLVAYSAEVEANARVAEARAVEVTAAANVAAENMNTVAVATTELSAAASEIARSAGDASRTAETAVQAADHANRLMEQLADSSARIGEVVESIRGIAAQTTMLALNATIEAARAGEAGRGFAVVASEVKDLAAETGSATADIVSRVDQIQADTQAALVALGEVAQVITEISSTQSVIAAAVEEQAVTTAEIDRSLTEAVTAVNQLAGTSHTVQVDHEMAKAAVAATLHRDAAFATVG